jgi:hypothetical protein
LGIERCGKINALNSGSESWTGIGVVAGFAVVVLIRQGPHRKQSDMRWRIELPQILQEVGRNYKTRNHLMEKLGDPMRIEATIVHGGPDGDGQGVGRTGLEEAVETRRPQGEVRDMARCEQEMHR